MVVVGGVSGARPPPPPPLNSQLDFLDLENFLVKVWGGGGGVSGASPPPTTTPPKLNSTFLDLEKWLFMPEICDDILLLPVGNYSFAQIIEIGLVPSTVTQNKFFLNQLKGARHK